MCFTEERKIECYKYEYEYEVCSAMNKLCVLSFGCADDAVSSPRMRFGRYMPTIVVYLRSSHYAVKQPSDP